MTQAETADRVADKLDIQDVLHRWCRGVDRKDWALARSAFHPDAIDDHGLIKGGVDQMIDWLTKRHTNIPQSMHTLTNITIEFAGPDEALAESYVVGYQRFPESDVAVRTSILGDALAQQRGDLDLTILGRYVDVMSRRQTEWRIKHRSVVFEKISAAIVGEYPKISSDWIEARRDDTDILYKKMKELAISR